MQLRFIEPGKPLEYAFIESFNTGVPEAAGRLGVVGRFRDECLNQHWFSSIRHADTSGNRLISGL
jgi:hypothetical protein